jgi:anionic cell wall polymer biosynthesis LytR-Cps2A-Psr (LCP) family protein
MVALTIIGAASAYGYVDWRFGQIQTKHLSALTTKGPNSGGGGGGKPFTLLVVGSDSRAALSASGDASQFGSSALVGGQRSDTIIVVRVVPKTRQLMMLSIPRDLWGTHPWARQQPHQHRLRHRRQPADPDDPTGPGYTHQPLCRGQLRHLP